MVTDILQQTIDRQISNSHLLDLAGSAFNGFVCAGVVLAIFAVIPSKFLMLDDRGTAADLLCVLIAVPQVPLPFPDTQGSQDGDSMDWSTM